MKRVIFAQFLPVDYEQMLYFLYQKCRQSSRTVTEYAEEFMRLASRNQLSESDAQQVVSMKCYRCQEVGYTSNQCRTTKRVNLAEGDKAHSESEDEGLIISPDVLFEDDDDHSQAFLGSSENIISRDIVTRLKLRLTKHPKPYKIGWIKAIGENEYYALWEVIEFGDSYKAPPEETGKGPPSESSAKKKGRTLRFNKYETAKELWEVILNTFGGNEATKKTKNNQLKQQYSNFTAEGSETLEQTFNRLQAIVSHLEFMDFEIKQDDLNQKFLTSLAPEWLMYTIVWRNKEDLDTMSLDDVYNHLKVYEPEVQKNLAPEWLMYTIVWRNKEDLDTMSLDDVYNHLKVYEPEVQKKSESNSQNMAFISSSNTSSGKGEVHTASVPTASIQVFTTSADVAAASLSHDTVCAYIASQSNGSQIKYEDITQIDEDDIEEMDIKWNMAILSMRADRPLRSQERGKRESYKQGPKEKEQAPKALMAIDGIGWDWSYIANEEENHALVADVEAPTEFALMAKSSSSSKNEVEARLVEFKEQEIKFCEKIKGLERDVEEVKDRIRTRRVLDTMQFPPPAQVYSPPKKDLSWTGLPEFVDDTVTDYSRPTPSIDESKGNTSDLQSNNFSVSKHRESSGSIISKPMIKFVKAADCPRVTKTNNTENARKSTVKYAEMYRNTTKSPKVRAIPRITMMIKDIGTVVALGTRLATYLTFLSMSLMMEDMCHLDKEEERLLVKA
nr:ribonuclease H-like domain-containing protein [Tanacetum cinerariifolium]